LQAITGTETTTLFTKPALQPRVFATVHRPAPRQSHCV